MGLTLSCIDFIFDKKEVKNKDIIFVGDHRISFDKFPDFYRKKFKLDKSINIDLKNSKANGLSQKKFLTKLIKKFGYENLYYLENFNADHIDFRIDLSLKNSSENIQKKFGIVIDNGTSIYASDVNNSLENIFKLIDNNGFLLTNLDPMSFNRFPMQPSPETLLDLMICNGLKSEIFIEQIFRNKRSKKKKYKLNYFDKHTLIIEHLTLSQFFFHIIYLIKKFFSFKKKNIKTIYADDYHELKKKNFDGLKNALLINNMKKSEIRKFNWKNNFVFRFIKDIYYRLNKVIEYNGRVVITFEAEKKKELNLNLKKNSSTIYYTILNDR